ncbi:unnamed protein product [Cuscuta epithymum]|uniref:Uncharacterized protein n=1 Tax=Cuscuta epithymum TaxID=186058 RepID=A0AAV0CTX8_9ASTE|nr:unnamed protein product [Cuscuta epithymum]
MPLFFLVKSASLNDSIRPPLTMSPVSHPFLSSVHHQLRGISRLRHPSSPLTRQGSPTELLIASCSPRRPPPNVASFVTRRTQSYLTLSRPMREEFRGGYKDAIKSRLSSRFFPFQMT